MLSALTAGWFMLPILLIFYAIYKSKEKEAGSKKVEFVFVLIGVIVSIVQLYVIFVHLPRYMYNK